MPAEIRSPAPLAGGNRAKVVTGPDHHTPERDSAQRSREQFAAVPLRALADLRFSAGHFRLLGAMAYFDRFGRNGYGCIASNRSLAEKAGLHEKTVPRLAADLELWGYIVAQRMPLDRRRRTYRLIYNDKAAIGNESVTDLPDRGISPHSAAEIGNEVVTDSAEIGNAEIAEVPAAVGDDPPQYILRSSSLRNPAEADATFVASTPFGDSEGNWKRAASLAAPAAPSANGIEHGSTAGATDSIRGEAFRKVGASTPGIQRMEFGQVASKVARLYRVDHARAVNAIECLTVDEYDRISRFGTTDADMLDVFAAALDRQAGAA